MNEATSEGRQLHRRLLKDEYDSGLEDFKIKTLNRVESLKYKLYVESEISKEVSNLLKNREDKNLNIDTFLTSFKEFSRSDKELFRSNIIQTYKQLVSVASSTNDSQRLSILETASNIVAKKLNIDVEEFSAAKNRFIRAQETTKILKEQRREIEDEVKAVKRQRLELEKLNRKAHENLAESNKELLEAIKGIKELSGLKAGLIDQLVKFGMDPNNPRFHET